MLREMLEKVIGEEIEQNKLTGANFIKEDSLAIIVDDMNEMQLRKFAANEMGDHVAYTVNIKQLAEWYGSYCLGLMNDE